ncbi:MAG: ABC transporter ATP-binding protein [Bdellovibrionales bacterium]|nr:ABC transporter ATP-binding protein [Bdellovibrionales bacterium]
MDKLVLRARNLHKEFTKGNERIAVVKGVNLDILEGDCMAIMGSSGAGKSTLMHLLGALDPPTHGEVFFGPKQQNLWKMSDEDLSDFRNRNLGFVFQFHYLLPEFSALENVMMPALISGMERPHAEAQARDLLKFVGLQHRINHRPAELSGGEQQRVAIARSVVLKPKLLFGDELTGNLDSENSKKVIDLLLELNQRFKIAVLMVTHDHDVASRIGKVLTMKDGKIVSS